MEILNIEKDTEVLCVTARSFPNGIMEAFQILGSKLPIGENRQVYGISYPGKKGEIIYKAAQTALHEREAGEYGLETFIIKEGAYISRFIPNFRDDVKSIGEAFTELLAYPGIDPNGYCLEMYVGPAAVRCMVGLKS
ncbi:MAG: hypothetical protein ABI741_07630 [Ferruginibacter sp.]